MIRHHLHIPMLAFQKRFYPATSFTDCWRVTLYHVNQPIFQTVVSNLSPCLLVAIGKVVVRRLLWTVGWQTYIWPNPVSMMTMFVCLPWVGVLFVFYKQGVVESLSDNIPPCPHPLSCAMETNVLGVRLILEAGKHKFFRTGERQNVQTHTYT